jgi:NAD(P)-dependent dehydrogenase (short-subunit alcohol dehydrogenase family)
MMPNVAAGRAALQYNLNGPNFVVDAGARSLEAAFSTARLLLHGGEKGGTKLVIVAAINANRWPVPYSDAARIQNEYAVAFAVTSRRYARELGLNVRRSLEPLMPRSEADRGQSPLAACDSTEEKLTLLVGSLEHASETPSSSVSKRAQDEFPIHVPQWTESPLVPQPNVRSMPGDERWLFLAKCDDEVVEELLAAYSQIGSACMVVLIGPSPRQLLNRFSLPHVMVLDVHDEENTKSTLSAMMDFSPKVVVALEKPDSWELSNVLNQVSGNKLCEALFLVMKQLVPRLRQGTAEVWGLFPGAWKGVVHPVTGAAIGLIKATRREIPACRMGVLSLSSGSLREALHGLQHERMNPDDSEWEVVHDGPRRLVRRLRGLNPDRPVSPTAAGVSLGAESVVIATGGARGVTAVLVDALLRDFGCTVVALGRSPLEKGPDDFDSPQAEQQFYAEFVKTNPHTSPREMKRRFESARGCWEANRTLEQLSKVGGRVHYMGLDVTNRDDVRRCVARIARDFGRVDLVLHGAGVQSSKKIDDRSISEFRTTFDVKVSGLNHLVEALRAHFHKFVPVHVLTSAYSIFGNDGQHDYGAANETLDRLCGLTSICPEHLWSSVAWSAWDGIGMTRGSEYRALAEKRNLALLGPTAGQSIFRSVLAGKTRSEINVPLSPSERTRYQIRTIPPPSHALPLSTVEFPIRLAELDCLAFHKARGVPTLPGAWILDYMVRAALWMAIHRPHAVSALMPSSWQRTAGTNGLDGRKGIPSPTVNFFSVEDMSFRRFVRVTNDHDANLRVVVDSTPTGYEAWLLGNVVHRAGMVLSSDQVFAEARLVPQLESSLANPTLNAMHGNGGNSVRTVSDPYCAGGQSVELSGPFDCLPSIEIGPLGRCATFSPDRSGKWGGVTPALLLDAALRVAGMHLVPNALHVPTRIGRVIIPVGMSTDSSEAWGWRIRTSTPTAEGDNIHCDRVEVTNEHGALQLSVDNAIVTQIR